MNEVAHIVQFYTEDKLLLESLCQFVRSALNDGESAILIASTPHCAELNKRLRVCGADVAASLEEGRCVVADASETLAKFMKGSKPDARKFVSEIGSLIEEARLKSGGTRVAVFGEMVAVLWEKKQYSAALELEDLWNDLAKTHSFYLRCAYPANSFQDEQSQVYSLICEKHSSVMPLQRSA